MASRHVRYAVTGVGLLCLGVLVALVSGLFQGGVRPEEHAIWAAYRAGEECDALEITYPLDGTLFPPEIAAPTFCWNDERTEADTWLVSIEFSDRTQRMNVLSDATTWTPSAQQWQTIKARSLGRTAKVTVLGVERAAQRRIASAGAVTIGTSRDEVGAPLFYREVNLPFIDAVKDPSRIRWRFGAVSSPQQPRVVLERLPVCGNCHSFSADGAVLGMDVDYANDKGSYVIAPVTKEILLDRSKIITWSDYKRQDAAPTFGLLSQVSPDGRHVVSTVKDRSVFVPKPDLEFSQLFFPLKGILAVYCRATGEFRALPGADDPRFVQSNPTWSPDGRTIVFARSKAHPLKVAPDTVLLRRQECREFLEGGKTFRFDLYRIPFNGGKGGKAEPLEGASNNGLSNYFARYSPDGKWIVFCRAKSFMLLQPDSELYIIPAAGGEARRLRCNTSRMNSWHSWSPNGRWLAFSSKLNGPYTQILLAHIDDAGRSSPPVVLSHFTASDRAANIPEFVNARPDAIARIREQFVDDQSFVRAAGQCLRANDPAGAERAYREGLRLNPRNAAAHDGLGALLANAGREHEAIEQFRRALDVEPKRASAHHNWGRTLGRLGKDAEAIEQFRKALAVDPGYAPAHDSWGRALVHLGRVHEGIRHFREAVRVDPTYARAHVGWGMALIRLRRVDEAVVCFRKAIEADPALAAAYSKLGEALGRLGKVREAIEQFKKAIAVDPTHAEALANWGVALVLLGKGAEAIEHFEKAVGTGRAHHGWGMALARLGKLDQAIEQYEKALAIDPGDRPTRDSLVRARLKRGNALAAQGQYERAVVHFQKAIAASPDDLMAINSLAWVLATCPRDDVRDGARAVELAERACKATHHQNPVLLDTLAAACAEAGKFPEAIAAATKAAALAERRHGPLAERIRRRLELYKAGKPYRQQP